MEELGRLDARVRRIGAPPLPADGVERFARSGLERSCGLGGKRRSNCGTALRSGSMSSHRMGLARSEARHGRFRLSRPIRGSLLWLFLRGCRPSP